jgi:hypothetical protein
MVWCGVNHILLVQPWQGIIGQAAGLGPIFQDEVVITHSNLLKFLS